MNNILIINGPNLNMLGVREEGHYGNITLEEIKDQCLKRANNLFKENNITWFQSNSEADIITIIQQKLDYKAIIINAGAYTHTSIAIMDALKTVKNINSNIVIVEVHLSNIYSREEFRQKSYISPVANATICGMKEYGYIYALEFIATQ